MMNLPIRLTLSTCLLVLVINIVPVASNEETMSETSADRVKRRSYQITPARLNSVSLYEASNTFRAAPHTVARPYYIPVYGRSGGSLLFYPPQSIYVNPGMPHDNPLIQSFGGPMYLPPNESPHFMSGETSKTPPKGTSTTAKPLAPSRIGEDDDNNYYDDDAPIWPGSSNAGGFVQMPLSGDRGESGPRPTRAPMVRATSPPLVHDVQSLSQSRPAQGQAFSRPERPTQPPPSFQEQTARTPAASSGQPSGPSNCVWAIISCCSASNPTILPQNCFEQRGCPGPFWGASPCESDYARAAIAAAVNYYNTNPRNN